MTAWHRIRRELWHHLPFTLAGAVLGVVLLVPLGRLPGAVSHRLFEAFHPLHVLASAAATVSMYGLYRRNGGRARGNIWLLLAVGYVGSVGLGTLSDSIIPYFGEALLGLPRARPHVGFIELWYLVNPAALVGIAVSYFRPAFRTSHVVHLALSTTASLAHIGMALDGVLPMPKYLGLLLFLLAAVWIPCTFSDIAFPLLFVGDRARRPAPATAPPG